MGSIDCTFNFEEPLLAKDVDLNQIQKVINTVGEYFFVSSQHLVINFVSAKTMQAINWQYYPFKKISSVLTFPLQKRHVQSSPNQPWGEIYVCLSVVFATNEKSDTALVFQEKTNNLIVHSLFHMLGYHHRNQQGWNLLLELKQAIFT